VTAGIHSSQFSSSFIINIYLKIMANPIFNVMETTPGGENDAAPAPTHIDCLISCKIQKCSHCDDVPALSQGK
jgi:hypothetical protein